MLEKLVAFCLRWPLTIVLSTLALSGAAAFVTADRFAIDTDTSNLFAPDVAWRKNERALYDAFPQVEDIIVAVIDADTPEKADDAARRLNEELQGRPLMSRVWRPDAHPFFYKNGLLFLSTPEVEKTVGVLIGQSNVLIPLAEDPTLRGLSSVMLANLKRVSASPRSMQLYLTGIDEFSRVFESTLKRENAQVDWEKLLAAGNAQQATTPVSYTHL
ncbi:MAG: hopanoid biosynthesis-associated RND transporter HpnN, partial [Methylocystis sp.]|nr:hopanoid biosynthesis-associated RND transporter HpnN [Methylocystis sp.]